jgi:STE24 endopeptidase
VKIALRIGLFLFIALPGMWSAAGARQISAPSTLMASAPPIQVQAAAQENSALPIPATVAEQAQEQEQKKVTAYTLPPEKYTKAVALGRFQFRFSLVSFFYGLFVLWIILRFRLAPKFRDWGEKASRHLAVQVLIFAPLFLITMAVLGLPSDIYGYTTEKKYGLSIQGWGSWFWDWTKGGLLSICLGFLLIWILYAVIRKSPRRWWFYFWLVSMPIAALLVFLQPLIIDPMFHKFEPLQQKDPALTASLETDGPARGTGYSTGTNVLDGRGEKTTELNAYVTGIGASKRIVVWDNTIAKMTTPQIVFVAGHEMGHYVLNHIWKGLAFAFVFLFILFYLAFRTIGWVLGRWGTAWGIRRVDDLASLPTSCYCCYHFRVHCRTN